ncbi:MAG TPA: CDC48 family AAA ATPase [Candidatus Lokiarchaeia archaeon]|nr:CDC48 family AAA ATPase [Candidatus Lokiarchaeia archaeon]
MEKRNPDEPPDDDFEPGRDNPDIDDYEPDEEPGPNEDNAEKKAFNLKVTEARQRDVGRSIIRIDPEAMDALGVKTGDIVEVMGKKKTSAIAWPAYPQDQGLGIIRIDGRIRKNASVSLGEDVKITRARKVSAKSVILAPTNTKLRSDSRFESFVKRKMLNLPVTKGDSIFISIGIGHEISFTVMNARPSGTVIIRQNTTLHVSENPIEEETPSGIPIITYEDIGGLEEEIQAIREMVELPLKHPELFKKLAIDPPKGVLLRGPPGCGKTLLAKAVANESEAHFISINGPEIMSKFYGESEKRIRSIFKEAEDNAPSIVFIDELDAIAPKREEVTGEVERRVVAQILGLMDGLHGRGRVVIIGATNRPNALDPALRRPGRFDREVEIKIPGYEGRMEVLQIHTRGMPLSTDDKERVDLEFIAQTTHGYVGADLAALCREAAMRCLRRYLPKLNVEDDTIDPEVLEQIVVTMDDFKEAMKSIQPSAIREVLIEIPKVHWDMVGGLEKTKEELKEAVEWPLKNPEAFTRMGIKPPKGILLFGPPGCGKTLLARAVATESEANFITVKGPELLSKWVGESEKAIREIFRKARSASPCIIFFDEFDSIVPMRGSRNGDSGVTERVISQFLTEIDGIEAVGDIVVIAATNRPDILDPAIIRPGRFDRLTFVPKPNKPEIRQMLDIFTKEMPLDADVDLDELADKMEGFSGADIGNFCKEAAIRSLREDIHADIVMMRHFVSVFDDIHASITPDMERYYEKIKDELLQRKTRKMGEENRLFT